MDQQSLFLIIGTAILAVVVYAVASLFKTEPSATAESSKKRTRSSSEGSEEAQSSGGGGGKKKALAAKGKKPTVSGHPLLAAELKGHTAPVTGVDFDIGGDYLTSCSEDRTIRVWYTKDFSEREHKYLRINVELDSATKVRFSPDSRALVTILKDGQNVRVFGLNRKKDNSIQGSTVLLNVDKAPLEDAPALVNVAIASSGKFILTNTVDSQFVVSTRKGEVLKIVNTRQVRHEWADVSPCGKFIACGGFMSDVKLFEVKFTKSGEFSDVVRAMELKGHDGVVHHFSFSADSRRVATVSADGTWKLWDIDVNYEYHQDPRILTSHKHCEPKSCDSMRVALSPDATTVAVASNGHVWLYSANDGNVVEPLGAVHTGEITALQFDPSSYLLCSAGADKRIHIWHNIIGIRANIEGTRTKIRSTKSDVVKLRLQHQLKELEEKLAQFY